MTSSPADDPSAAVDPGADRQPPAAPGQSGRLAIIGVGKIGEALLAGVIGSGRAVDSLMISGRSPARLSAVADRYGVRVAGVAEAAREADVLVIAVKPQDIDPLLAQIRDEITPGTLVVSLAAGLPTALFEKNLPADTAVVRVMPNTALLLGEAMSAISPGAHAQARHLDEVEALLASVGKVVRVPEEQQDAVTALSGSGPAYFFYLVEAMIDAGILLGLPRSVSTDLIIQSAVGAATMLRDSGEHPVALREAVTSPGGTTIAAIRELENHRVRAALLAAIEAAAVRSGELGQRHR